ncbi:MAG: hypothetical protein QFF03_20830, partial [Pseudomonadota bacterium]|nr:hypothetical protein [Pseudomonadota bacterium]
RRRGAININLTATSARRFHAIMMPPQRRTETPPITGHRGQQILLYCSFERLLRGALCGIDSSNAAAFAAVLASKPVNSKEVTIKMKIRASSISKILVSLSTDYFAGEVLTLRALPNHLDDDLSLGPPLLKIQQSFLRLIERENLVDDRMDA